MYQIIVDISAAYARLALRIYFTVALTTISFIGDHCCTIRVKLRLARGHRVPLSQMTGWLSGLNAAIATFGLRTSPAGWLGYIMLFCSLLWLASDLAVSTLVTTTMQPSRCLFNTTGKFQVMSLVDFHAWVGVTNVGPIYNLIYQAQLTSIQNGGLNGIYKKINTDPNFRADSRDVLGQWVCEFTGVEAIYTGDASPAAIESDMLSRGLIYGESYDYSFQEWPDHTTGHLVYLSASQAQGAICHGTRER